MKRTAYILLAIVLIGYLGVCVAIDVFQRSLIYHPAQRLVTATDSTMSLPVDGAELVVTVRRRDGPKAIVYFGGKGEDVSRNLDSYAKAFPEHALYFMHYRGYGGSTGKPTEKDNIADALALVEKVRMLHPEISLFGRSLGTGIAVQVASQVASTRVVLITPYDSIVGIGAERYPFLPVRWLMNDTYESGKFAASIKTPTTFVTAENDEIIPRASTENLLNKFGQGIAKMIIIEGVGHNNLGKNQKYLETLQAALK